MSIAQQREGLVRAPCDPHLAKHTFTTAMPSLVQSQNRIIIDNIGQQPFLAMSPPNNTDPVQLRSAIQLKPGAKKQDYLEPFLFPLNLSFTDLEQDDEL